MAVNRWQYVRKLLSTKNDADTRGLQLGGGQIIDWLPDEDGAVLMSRLYLPIDHLGSRMGSDREGLAVDWLDTRNLQIKTLETPSKGACEYLTDGRGMVRIIGRSTRGSNGQDSGIVAIPIENQVPDLAETQRLQLRRRQRLDPAAVDHDMNVVYGFKKKDGRKAVYTVALEARSARI